MKKVLVVDDDKEFLQEMSEMLKLNGCSPVTISESSAAVSEASRIKPDLILLDLKMEKVSGFQVADALGKLAETSSIPVVAVTGVFTEKEHRLLMKACNIRDCIHKPVQPDQIIDLIEKLK